MASIAKVVKTLFKVFGRAAGKSIVVQTEAAFDQQRETEFWQLPGVAARPTKKDRVIELPIGRGGYRVVIASKNYRVAIEPKEGEFILYSLNEAGDTEQARTHLKQDGTIESKNDNGHVVLKSDGNIDLNGDARTFVTHAELDTALQALVTYINGHTHSGVTTGNSASGPPASPTSLDISSAEAKTVRTK